MVWSLCLTSPLSNGRTRNSFEFQPPGFVSNMCISIVGAEVFDGSIFSNASVSFCGCVGSVRSTHDITAYNELRTPIGSLEVAEAVGNSVLRRRTESPKSLTT